MRELQLGTSGYTVPLNSGIIFYRIAENDQKQRMLRPGWWLLSIGCGVQVDTFVGPWVGGITVDLFAFPIILHYLYCTLLHLYLWLWLCND